MSQHPLIVAKTAVEDPVVTKILSVWCPNYTPHDYVTLCGVQPMLVSRALLWMNASGLIMEDHSSGQPMLNPQIMNLVIALLLTETKLKPKNKEEDHDGDSE